MVNVNKTVAKSGAQKQPATTQRRPRNTELNSSKKELTPIQKRIQNARKANLNSSRRFGEFEYRPVSAQELAERDGITLDELQGFIDDWEGQGYNVSGFLLCDDYAAVSGGNDVLVETDNGVYLWDEGGDLVDVDELDSSCGSKLNSSDDESGDHASDTDGGESVGEGVEEAMITTESGNEVALSDIKIVQNPDTNELALFVKETEDDEIPEGFVVIADAAQAALPSNNTCPECGQSPCVCEGAGETGGEGEGEELDSSKKGELNCDVDTVDEHEMLVTYVEALEDTYNDLLVKEKLFGDADERSLRECLADWDDHKALVALSEAISDLMLGDEVMQSILGVYDPLGLGDVNSSLEPSTADTNQPKQQFQVYYEDENGNEIRKPAVITISDNLEGMDLYEAIQEQFEVEYPGCSWTTICDMNDEVKMDSSKKSELDSSVHDNPALKLFVEKIKKNAEQVSTVPTTEGDGSGYKIIIRGMAPEDIEPIAAEFGMQLSGIKPLEDGFAVLVDNDSLNSSEVDLNNEEFVDEGAMRYKDYLITGGEKSGGYIAVSPYGKFSPHIYKTIDECKAAIDKDIKIRFPEFEH